MNSNSSVGIRQYYDRLANTIRLFHLLRIESLSTLLKHSKSLGLRQSLGILKSELNRGSPGPNHSPLGEALGFIAAEPLPIEKLKVPVDIVVPVYGTPPAVIRMFDSLLKNTEINHRIILIDDGNPDLETQNFLKKIESKHPNCTLVRHDRNRGFVAAANLGIKMSRNHVALLNTDIELPPNWVNRLMTPLIKRPRVATTTPFSNAGSLCSFPYSMVDASPFNDLSVDRIDAAFQRVRSKTFEIELPTAVGFCMGMHRETIKRIGDFDESTFGKGYGEENDWSRRALSAGYRNLLVPNLFVSHEGGASFGKKERESMSQKNLARLTQKHPDYMEAVDSFLLQDPMKLLREALLLLACCVLAKNKPNFFVGEKSGRKGLFHRYFANAILGNHPLIHLTSAQNGRFTFLQVFYKSHQLSFRTHSAVEVESLLRMISIDRVHIASGELSPEEFISTGCR